jgi:hypothetical protein
VRAPLNGNEPKQTAACYEERRKKGMRGRQRVT